MEEIIPRKLTSPDKNISNQADTNVKSSENPSSSKQPSRMQVLTDLVAESQANPIAAGNKESPISKNFILFCSL